MLYVPQLLLHVSRPVRWDSDHVVLLDDETGQLPVRLFVTICLTGCISALTFDASINRIAAWVIGTRNRKSPPRAAEPTLSCASWKRRAITLARLALLEEQIAAVAGGLGNVLLTSRYASR